MKKLLLIILMCALTLLFCGCTAATNERKFPQLRIAPSNNYVDNIYIPLRDNHNFNIQHLYDEVKTENGYDIIIHLTKNEIGD